MTQYMIISLPFAILPPSNELTMIFKRRKILGKQLKQSKKYIHLLHKQDVVFKQLGRTDIPSNIPLQTTFRIKQEKTEKVHLELRESGSGCLKIKKYFDHDLTSPKEFKTIRENCKGALFRGLKKLKKSLEGSSIVTDQVFIYVYWETEDFETAKARAMNTITKLVGTKIISEVKEDDAIFISKKAVIFLTRDRLSRYGRTKLMHSQFYALTLFSCIEIVTNYLSNINWTELLEKDWTKILFQHNPYILAGNFRISSTLLNGSARHCFLLLDKLLGIRNRYKAKLLRVIDLPNLGYFGLISIFLHTRWLPIDGIKNPSMLNIETVPGQLDEESQKIIDYLLHRMELFQNLDLKNGNAISRFDQLIQYRGGDVVSGIAKGLEYSSGRNNKRIEEKLNNLERARIITSYHPPKAKGLRRNGKAYLILIDKSSLKELLVDLIESILRTQ